MDRIDDAEVLVRVKVIRPALEEIITEKALLEDPLGFKGMLQAVLKVGNASFGCWLFKLSSYLRGCFPPPPFVLGF